MLPSIVLYAGTAKVLAAFIRNDRRLPGMCKNTVDFARVIVSAVMLREIGKSSGAGSEIGNHRA